MYSQYHIKSSVDHVRQKGISLWFITDSTGGHEHWYSNVFNSMTSSSNYPISIQTASQCVKEKVVEGILGWMKKVRRLGAALSAYPNIASFTNRTWEKERKDFLKAYLKKFDAEEVEVLRQVYKELAARNPGAGIDKETFLEYFPLPGLWGERLFYRFDYKCLGAVDFEEFLVAIAIFDLNGDGLLQKEELVAMLSNLPNLDRYVRGKTSRNTISPTPSAWHSISFAPASSPNSFLHHDDPCVLDRNHIHTKSIGTNTLVTTQETLNAECISDVTFHGNELQKNGNISLERDWSKSALSVDPYNNTGGDPLCQSNPNTTSSYSSPSHINRMTVAPHSQDVLSTYVTKDDTIRVAGNKCFNPREQSCHGTNRNMHTKEALSCRKASIVGTLTTENNAIDVELLVDEIIEECKFSETDSLTFIEFKTWLERHDVILAMFTECLHEEVWGCQGNALYRQRNRSKEFQDVTLNSSQPLDPAHYWNTPRDVEGRKRGVVDVRPDSFYKIKKLFTVSVCSTLSAILEGRDYQKILGDSDTRSLQSLSSPQDKQSLGFLLNMPKRTLQHVVSKTPSCSSCNILSGCECPSVQDIHPRRTREILDHQLFQLVQAANPSVDVRMLHETLVSGKLDDKICLFTCPSCHLLLVVCPRCKRCSSSLQLFQGMVVVECENCVEHVPYRFYNCWHCNWSFSDAADMVDQCAPLHEGFLYKIGRRSNKLRKRYFVLVDNLLYYYKRKEDTKPLRFFFLEGCFVTAIDEKPKKTSGRRTEPHSVSTRNVTVVNAGSGKRICSLSDKPPFWRKTTALHALNHGGSRNRFSLPKLTTFAFTTLGFSVLSSSLHNKYGLSISHGLGKLPSRDFYADTHDDREQWMKALRLAMNQQVVSDCYQIGEVVGQGKFSVVHRAFSRDPRRRVEEVVIKFIEKQKMSGQEQELLRSEVAILRLLRHPHVISLRQIFNSPTHIYIVMEYVKGGELYDLIQKKRILTESQVNRIVFQLLFTIDYLHKCGIIHRDIKPENILLTDASSDDADIKITDFGLSCICGPCEYVTRPCGTLAYVAPEVLTLHGYNHKVDVWSVGVIMYLLLRGRLPFPVTRLRATAPCGAGIGHSRERSAHVASVYPTQLNFSGCIWDRVSSSAKDLLRKLLQCDPNKRISAHDALDHIWIKNPTAVISEATQDLNADIQSSIEEETDLRINPYAVKTQFDHPNTLHPTENEYHAFSRQPRSQCNNTSRPSSPLYSGPPSSVSRQHQLSRSEASSLSSSFPDVVSSSHIVDPLNFHVPSPSFSLACDSHADCFSYNPSRKRLLDVTAASFTVLPKPPLY